MFCGRENERLRQEAAEPLRDLEVAHCALHVVLPSMCPRPPTPHPLPHLGRRRAGAPGGVLGWGVGLPLGADVLQRHEAQGLGALRGRHDGGWVARCAGLRWAALDGRRMFCVRAPLENDMAAGGWRATLR